MSLLMHRSVVIFATASCNSDVTSARLVLQNARTALSATFAHITKTNFKNKRSFLYKRVEAISPFFGDIFLKKIPKSY